MRSISDITAHWKYDTRDLQQKNIFSGSSGNEANFDNQSRASFQACSPVEKCQNLLFCFLGRLSHQLTTQLHIPSVLLTRLLPNRIRKTPTKKKRPYLRPFPCLTFVWLASPDLKMLDVRDAKIICLCLFEESCGAAQWAALQICSSARSALFPNTAAAASQKLLQALHCLQHQILPDELDVIGQKLGEIQRAVRGQIFHLSAGKEHAVAAPSSFWLQLCSCSALLLQQLQHRLQPKQPRRHLPPV